MHGQVADGSESGGLAPDDRSAGQAMGRAVRNLGGDGAVYQSVRCPYGLALALFWPDCVELPVTQARTAVPPRLGWSPDAPLPRARQPRVDAYWVGGQADDDKRRLSGAEIYPPAKDRAEQAGVIRRRLLLAAGIGRADGLAITAERGPGGGQAAIPGSCAFRPGRLLSCSAAFRTARPARPACWASNQVRELLDVHVALHSERVGELNEAAIIFSEMAVNARRADVLARQLGVDPMAAARHCATRASISSLPAMAL